MSALQANALDATSVLRAVMQDKQATAAARVTAAAKLIDLSLRAREKLEIEERLAAVEAALMGTYFIVRLERPPAEVAGEKNGHHAPQLVPFDEAVRRKYKQLGTEYAATHLVVQRARYYYNRIAVCIGVTPDCVPFCPVDLP